MSRHYYDRHPHPGGQLPYPRYARGRAVTRSRKDTSHTFHLIMTVLTAGMWGLVVWFPLTVWHRIGPREKSTTYYW
jgi:hypothetical protein